VPDEDGRMHMRGEDAMIQYVIDGIPVTMNQTRIYTPLFDASLIESADLLRGSLNPEYGVATSGVLNISTKSGFDAPTFGHALYSYGTYNNMSQGVDFGGHIADVVAYYGAYNSYSSGRYLDPISSFDANHTSGDGGDYFGKLNFILSSTTDLNLLGYYSTAKYGIPNGSDTSKQDQNQDLRSLLGGARLNVTLTPQSVFSVLAYFRQQKADLTSNGMDRLTSPADDSFALAHNDKYFVGAHRKNSQTGGQLEYTSKTNWFDVPNQFKAGVGGELYPIDEYFTFAVTNPNLSNASVSGGDARLRPYDLNLPNSKPFLVDTSATGKRLFGFVQDELTMGAFTLTGGVRYDLYQLLLNEGDISPRLNVVWRATDDLLVRASYNHMFMQAPVENILVSSSSAARELVGAEQGSTPQLVRSEKSNVFEVGAGYRINPFLSADLTGYAKLIDNFVVKVELGNSGVIFPANIKSGLVGGGELELTLREWNNFSGRLSFATTVSKGNIPSDGTSPFGAGLVLGEEGENYSHPFTGEDMFNTEHNQLLTSSFTLRYNHPSGIFAVVGGRFDSGLPFDLADSTGRGLDEAESRVELRRRGYSDAVIDMLSLTSEMPGSPDKYVAPHAVFDLSIGANINLFGPPMRVTGSVLNVLDTKYLYKFESTFGGTHFGAPRMFLLRAEILTGS
jgi:outer membrane receptor protein involved in Fe transport